MCLHVLRVSLFPFSLPPPPLFGLFFSGHPMSFFSLESTTIDTQTHTKKVEAEKRRRKRHSEMSYVLLVVERAARANKRSLIGLISGGLVLFVCLSTLTQQTQ